MSVKLRLVIAEVEVEGTKEEVAKALQGIVATVNKDLGLPPVPMRVEIAKTRKRPVRK